MNYSRRCPVCGTPIPTHTDWCPKCGSDITAGGNIKSTWRSGEELVRERMEELNIETFRDLGPFGGLEEMGGITAAHNEYELAIGNMVEAAHCILGSIFKLMYNDGKDWKRHLGIEKGHIKEEMKKIEYIMGEYTKPLYLGRTWRDGRKSVNYMRKKSAKLALIASRNKNFTKHMDMPKKLKDLAVQCFETIRVVAILTKHSVEGRKSKPSENVFNNKQLIEEVRKLKSEVNKVLNINI